MSLNWFWLWKAFLFSLGSIYFNAYFFVYITLYFQLLSLDISLSVLFNFDVAILKHIWVITYSF